MTKRYTLFLNLLILQLTSAYSQQLDSLQYFEMYQDSITNVRANSVSSLSTKSELHFNTTGSIEKLEAEQFNNSGSLHYLHDISRLRGMNMTQSGILNTSLNSGGFTRTINSGFLQRFDGVDLQLPDQNFTIANLGGTSELDFFRAEAIPLPASSVYGANALNGVLNVFSKDPFEHTGLSALVKIGTNKISSASGATDVPIYQLGLRYAHNFNDKVALKFNLSYFETQNWEPDYNGNARFLSNNNGSQTDDPGFDGVNNYGDEFSTIIPFGTNGSDVDVSRTGYPEHELLDYKADNVLFDFAAHYRFYKHVTAILSIGANEGNAMVSGHNRTLLPNLLQTKIRFEINGGNFFVRYFNVSHEHDQSIDTKLLGRNLNLFGKPHTAWFIDFSAAFGGGLTSIGIPSGDVGAARAFADSPGLNVFGVFRDRPDPLDPDFDGVVNLIKTNQVQGLSPVISEFQSEQQLSHFEAFYDLDKHIPWFGAQLGFVSRDYDVGDNNTSIYSFINASGYRERSFYGQLSKLLVDDKLSLQLNLRLDYNDLQDNNNSFSFGSNYQLTENHSFRLSYREGYRNPTWQEQNGFRDIGPGQLRGGSTELQFVFINNQGQTSVPFAGNSVYLNNVNEFDKKLREGVVAGEQKSDIALRHLDIIGNGILQNGDLQSLSDEKKNIVEVGYRSKITRSLTIDFSGYYSTTENLIGSVGVVRPFGLVNPPIADTLGAIDALRDDRRRQLFWFWQNASEPINSYGIWIGTQVAIPKEFYLNMNGSWQDFNTSENRITIGFNAPEYIFNFAFGNDNLWKDLGFQLAGHWQESFEWQGITGNGNVDSFFTLDGQVNYKIKHLKTQVKFGATNLLQENYYDNFGGPTVGSTYYFSVILEDLLN